MQLRSVVGQEVVEFQACRWTGTATATAAEGKLTRQFFRRLVEVLRATAGADAVPVHFYVWSATEIKHLTEGCGRAGEGLLGHLSQLFGGREGLEQLLYSAAEVHIADRSGICPRLPIDARRSAGGERAEPAPR